MISNIYNNNNIHFRAWSCQRRDGIDIVRRAKLSNKNYSELLPRPRNIYVQVPFGRRLNYIGDLIRVFTPIYNLALQTFPQSTLHLYAGNSFSEGKYMMQDAIMYHTLFKLIGNSSGYERTVPDPLNGDLIFGRDLRSGLLIDVIMNGERGQLVHSALDTELQYGVGLNHWKKFLRQYTINSSQEIRPNIWPAAQEVDNASDIFQSLNLNTRGRNIAFNLGGGGIAYDFERRWPVEKFVDLAKQLLEADKEAKIVILWGPKESALKDEYEKRAKTVITNPQISERVRYPERVLTVGELFEVFKKVDLVVTSDTGPAHIACTAAYYADHLKVSVLVHPKISIQHWYSGYNREQIIAIESPGFHIEDIDPDKVLRACLSARDGSAFG